MTCTMHVATMTLESSKTLYSKLNEHGSLIATTDELTKFMSVNARPRLPARRLWQDA